MRNKRSAVSKNSQIEGGVNQLTMNCPGTVTENELPTAKSSLLNPLSSNHIQYVLTDITNTKGVHGILCIHLLSFKRGLPHAHIILWLFEADKSTSPFDVDQLISTEILDKLVDPELYELVGSYMVHGPCGRSSRIAPCMKDGKCSKYFPKRYNAHTILDEKGYPTYCRRNDGRTVSRKGVKLDNRFVVPYDARFLKLFCGHLNIEKTNQSRAIKYVSSCEASWRIFGFEIHHRHPPVERLSFHLPQQQSIYYTQGETMSSLVNNPRVKESMFLAWFEKNKDDPFARTLTYSQFPNHFTFVREKRFWKICERDFSVGRIGHCTPAQGELYYLRLFLTKVRGAKTYTDIRTVNTVIYPTFGEACYTLGLLDDDEEYIDAIKETKEILCEDLLHITHGDNRFPDLQISSADKEAACLSIIEKLLLRNGRSLNDYPSLPTPDTYNIFDISNQLILQELNYNKLKEREESERLQRLMTAEQKQMFDEIMGAVSSKKGRFFFLHGVGGTGKTFIWNALTASVRSNGGIILNVASSGIAATLLPSEYLNAIKCSGFPHHKLVLKIGVPVMLIRNIDQAAGLCNGTRLQITQLGKNVVKAKALNGTSVGLYLPIPIFSHGQLYVAMSRAKNFSGLKILILNEFGKYSNTTINVVYREVF
ncbi:hypothetical protein K1719_022216 [Acacia pycnantha]|nr:hypothetical protein K1719_022216 [Acacia pycnantha]